MATEGGPEPATDRPNWGSGAAPPSAAALPPALAAALDRAFGGFFVLDRDLALGGDPQHPAARAHLVGVDGDGRLVLGLQLAVEEVPGALERALDLAALADSRRALLARHLGRALAPSGACVALVAGTFPDAIVRRAAVIGRSRVRLFEARELHSAHGVSIAYVALGADAIPAVDVPGFLATLPAERASRATELVARLARLSLGCAPTCTAEGLEWRLGETLLCRVAASVDGLVGQVEGGALALADGPALEAFLDAALERFLRLDSPLRA